MVVFHGLIHDIASDKTMMKNYLGI